MPAVSIRSKTLPGFRPLLRRIEDQLLDAPIEYFCDEQHVLGGARHFVNPAELLELLAGLAQHDQHLAVQAQLVDADRMGMGAVEHLVPAA